MTTLKPLGDRVVIKPLPREEMTKSGIYLPDTAKEKPQEGTNARGPDDNLHRSATMIDKPEMQKEDVAPSMPEEQPARVWGTWPPPTQEAANSQSGGSHGIVVRTIVVDDQANVRRRLRWELRLEPNLEVVGEAETGAQGVALAQDLRPDIVIMDVEMPVMDGIQTAQYLHDLAPDCVIVLLTTKDTFETHGRAMAAGARVIVEKGNLPIFRASLHGLVRFVRARNAPAWPDIGAPSAPLEESQA